MFPLFGSKGLTRGDRFRFPNRLAAQRAATTASAVPRMGDSSDLLPNR